MAIHLGLDGCDPGENKKAGPRAGSFSYSETDYFLVSVVVSVLVAVLPDGVVMVVCLVVSVVVGALLAGGGVGASAGFTSTLTAGGGAGQAGGVETSVFRPGRPQGDGARRGFAHCIC